MDVTAVRRPPTQFVNGALKQQPNWLRQNKKTNSFFDFAGSVADHFKGRDCEM
jgi:hypothetical protein